MARPRKYSNAADRQKAYRERHGGVAKTPSLFGAEPEAKAPRPDHRDETLTLLALADMIGALKHIGYISANKLEVYEMVFAGDPVLKLLVELMEQRLAFRAAEGEALDSREVDGGLTVRQSEAGGVLSRFHFCCDLLEAASAHVPIAHDAARGVDELRMIARAMGAREHAARVWGEMSVTLFKKILAWAFEVSNYWPSRLRTLDDVLRAMGTLREQYQKYHAHLPEAEGGNEVQKLQTP